jgi:L-glyceraldehyde 3-phosphate reductase
MLDRWVEPELLDTLDREGIGSIVFSPLAQGKLTSRYLGGIPSDSRAGREETFLQSKEITKEYLQQAKKLNAIAEGRGQTLAQMALAWVLRRETVTSALIGASKVSQVEDCVAATKNLAFGSDELATIDGILGD